MFESWAYVLSNVTKESIELTYKYRINGAIKPDTILFSINLGLNTALTRSIKINGHMFMCVPYAAMLAYNYHKTKDWKKSILDKKTLIVFLISIVLHMINNSLKFDKEYLRTLALIAITVALLLSNLYAIRLCLQQVAREGKYVSGQGLALGERTVPLDNAANSQGQSVPAGNGGAFAADVLTVQSMGSVLKGAVWQCRGTVLVGKLNDCAIRFPPDTACLSRVHCRLKNCGTYWTICDVGSSYGTRCNGVKLDANREYTLSRGSVLELGSPNVCLKIQ